MFRDHYLLDISGKKVIFLLVHYMQWLFLLFKWQGKIFHTIEKFKRLKLDK